jgi:hypothetical protein
MYIIIIVIIVIIIKINIYIYIHMWLHHMDPTLAARPRLPRWEASCSSSRPGNGQHPAWNPWEIQMDVG